MYQKLIKSGNTLEHFIYERTPAIIEQRNDALRGLERHRHRVRKDKSEGLAQTLVRRQDNAKRAQVAFGRLCRANFGELETAVYATFSFRPTEKWEQPTLQQGYSLFHIFTVRLRQRYSPNVRYIAVPERGKRNTQRLHFHALLWGLPLDEIKRERETRNFAKVWQYGYVDVVVTDNNPKVGYYLAKYLSKSYTDPMTFNSRSYVASRNIRRPEIFISFVPYILEYEFPDAQLISSRTYETKYVGECQYKVYELPEQNDKSNIQPI